MDIHYTKSTKREKMWVEGGGVVPTKIGWLRMRQWEWREVRMALWTKHIQQTNIQTTKGNQKNCHDIF